MFCCLVKDGLFSPSVLQAQFLDGSAVVDFELFAKETDNSQRWPMTTLLDPLSIDRVRRNVVALMPIFGSDDFEDITAENRISTHDESASFRLRILQSIHLSNCHVSHIHSCVLSCRSRNSWISAIQNLAHKCLRRISMFCEGRPGH